MYDNNTQANGIVTSSAVNDHSILIALNILSSYALTYLMLLCIHHYIMIDK